MMNQNVIPLHDTKTGCELIQAEVKAINANAVVIDTAYGIVHAKKAFSCIVALCVNDIVLVNNTGEVFHILSILERPENSAINLDFPGDVKMCSTSGKIDLHAAEGINLISSADTCVVAKSLNMTAVDMKVQANSLHTMVNNIEALSKNVKLKTKVLDTVAEQISQTTNILVRWVQTVETINIGNLVQKVRNNMTSHSNQAVITASKDLRIDAERIHMG